MEFCSVREISVLWDVSERLVQRLCAEGRIEGAQKLSGSWIIPSDAQKPKNLRTTRSDDQNFKEDEANTLKQHASNRNLYAQKNPPAETPSTSSKDFPREPLQSTILANLMPLMNTSFTPGNCQNTINQFEDPDLRTIALAEYCYFSGKAEEAAQITGGFLSHENLAIRLSACLIYAYANLPLGKINQARFALAEMQLELNAHKDSLPQENKAIEGFVTYAASVLLHLPLPKGLPPVEAFLPLLPSGLRTFALYVHAHQLYLEGDYSRSLGLVEAALMMDNATHPISEIYLRLVAVMDYMSLKRTEDARAHLLAAWDLARPDGLIEAFGEHHGLLGGMLESVIKKDWPEDFKKIIDITYRFSAGWRRVHNPVTQETIADNLTTTEFAVSMLAARKWTNKEISIHLDVSENTVKSYLASAFRKLGISRRQDLEQYMLK